VTSIRRGPAEVPVAGLDEPCVVASNLIHTLDWQQRKVKKVADTNMTLLNEVLARRLPLIGAQA
jgi:mRNA interferase MazF